ncbi:GGDEF domain-containing protein [Acetobacter oeni]|uniref:Diguanylate cyclase DosC n=1 Tax=Acetobacter oeni TaxID=304077 RepID=A0A511XFR6_9PROT|nr:GGDEF domain-containing protein [Acetobacter oeni]MBB3882277.1 diguanylate cyclase [Acetobacter oeni]NHO18030.1 diguanylate cyclase [Acetobacter oeni]GBR01130.1 diguanylate cyclase [Acetobacter oeni LMG 21952]GEN61803.1 diguanylate cyclase [Acetobacter oeni]
MDHPLASPETGTFKRDRDEWRAVIDGADNAVRLDVSRLVGRIAPRCTEVFYATLLSNPEGKVFISSEVVQERLHEALTNWLVFLFPERAPDVTRLMTLQERIGLVHARMRIPMTLVLQGIRALKQELRLNLFAIDMPRDRLLQALTYTMTMIDIAVEIMGQELSKDLKKEIESDEACRIFSLGQDIAVEKEVQRSALLDWGHRVLLAICCRTPPPLPALEKSAFGLWLNHKAGLLFSGRNGLHAVRMIVSRIDHELLPTLMKDMPVQPVRIQELQGLIEEIRFLMNDMFAESALLEGGRDPLTTALSRRFLPTILSREVSLSLRRKTSFSILLLDVDHFKRVNDRFGHTRGDAVLRNVSDIISTQCRPSDFVFRYGGEEFLVALTETSGQEGLVVAERIREAVYAEGLQQDEKVTVSVGVAEFAGHPDYEQLIHEADTALYQAKTQGRNRCILHDRQERIVTDRIS